MTDSHLSDDQLSTLVDGAGSVDEARRHAGGCRACGQRLERLEEARRLVATPVAPVPASVRAAAIRTVLDAARTADAPPGADPADDAGLEPGVVTPIESTDASRRLRRMRILTAAAAAVVVGGAVGVPLALSGSRPAATSAASRLRSGTPGHRSQSAATTEPSGSTSPSLFRPEATGAAGALSGAAALGLPDLGTVSTLTQLRSSVLGLVSAPATRTTPAPSPAAAAPSGPGAATGTAGANGAAGPGAAGASAPTAAGSPAEASTVPASSRAVAAFEACQSAVLAADPGRAVQRLATATVGGVPGLVYVLGPAGSASSAAAPAIVTGQGVMVVTSRSGCRVLGSQAL